MCCCVFCNQVSSPFLLLFTTFFVKPQVFCKTLLFPLYGCCLLSFHIHQQHGVLAHWSCRYTTNTTKYSHLSHKTMLLAVTTSFTLRMQAPYNLIQSMLMQAPYNLFHLAHPSTTQPHASTTRSPSTLRTFPTGRLYTCLHISDTGGWGLALASSTAVSTSFLISCV